MISFILSRDPNYSDSIMFLYNFGYNGFFGKGLSIKDVRSQGEGGL